MLEADATFVSHMTGGVYCFSEGVEEISPTHTPNAYDANEELLPCCYIRPETTQPDGPHDHGAVEYVALYFYQRSGYAATTSAMRRAYTLLQRAQFNAEKVFELFHTDHVWGQRDQQLGANLQMSRYAGTLMQV